MIARQARCVLVTGGAVRVGQTVARRFAAAGWDVAIHCNTSTSEADLLAEELARTGIAARRYEYDLSDPASHAALIEHVYDDFGGLGGLINSASIFERDDLSTMTTESWQAHRRINLDAPIFLTQAYLRLADRCGWVLNLLDAKVFQTTAAFFSYTMSKLALADATRMLAMACAPTLRVNGVAPGLVLPSGKQTEADFRRVHNDNPLGKGPTPDQLADAALYLAQAETVTGQIVTVDGGAHFYTPRPGGGF